MSEVFPEDPIFESFETDVYDSDVVVGGSFSAGNWAIGSVVITPIPNKETSFTVTNLDLSGRGQIYYQVSAKTNDPWIRVREVTVNNMNTRSFDIVIYRTSRTPTVVHYFVYRDPE